MTAIHQLLAGFANGDAISNEAIVMRSIFRSWGFDSEIFCERKRIIPELRKEARDLSECQAAFKPDDVAFLHLSIGSDVNDVFRSLACRKALLYHNVTPARYFDLVNRQTSFSLEKGRRQVGSLVNVAQVNLADSRFNADELATLGYKDVHVLPLVLDLEKLKSEPDRKILRAYGDGTINVLFVGRCAPNKKIEELVKAFYYFHRFVEPDSRLIQVGSYAGTERYHNLLLAQIRDMELSDVRFIGSVPQPMLNAFYKSAHIFLSMSEHEGFCIPVIESMVFDVPVIALGATAVPETMDGAGVLIREKNFEAIAEMMGRLVHDTTLRQAVIKKQRERIARYSSRDLAAELRQMLSPLIKV